jgi:hypothetical protein
MKLTIIEKENETVIKRGRKTFATISYNKNPDYKWVIYFKTNIALSGYETKEKAIERAEKMNESFNEVLTNL